MTTTYFTGNPFEATGATVTLTAITGTGTPAGSYTPTHNAGKYTVTTSGLSGRFELRAFNSDAELFAFYEVDIGNKEWAYEPGQAIESLDTDALAADVYQLLRGSSAAKNNIPIAGNVIVQAHNTDFVTTFPISTGVSDAIEFTIGCKHAEKLMARSAVGLVRLLGENAGVASDAAVTRVDAANVRVMVRARALSQIYKSDDQVFTLEMRSYNATETTGKYEADFTLYYAVGKGIASSV